MFNPIPKPITYKNPDYLNYIKRQPCVVCGQAAEPHHIRKIKWGAGVGKKVHDYLAIPLCRKHHNDEHTMLHLDRNMIDIEIVTINLLMNYIESKRK